MNRNLRSTPPSNAGPQWISGPQLAGFAASNTNAHRLCSATDAWIERFGDDLLISYQHDVARDELLDGLAAWVQGNQFSYRRIFGKFLPRQNAERAAPLLLEGNSSLPLTTIVTENGMKFGMDFAAGYSAGLFIDQRANRTAVRGMGVKRLLNTFAYTCSFSVAAALEGAKTMSIDLSKKSLDRGRENFALNDLDSTAGHRFLADDVLNVLPRLARKGETFDAIILDPPTFSRGNDGRKFQVERDFEALLLATLEVAAPGASVLLSTNCTRLGHRAMETIGRHALKVTRRTGEFQRGSTLPDFPTGAGPTTMWLRLR